MSDLHQSVCSSRPICQFFAKRQCKKGRFCPFLHVITIDREGISQQDVPIAEKLGETEAVNDKEDAAALPKNQRSNQKRPVCNYFFRNGWCRYGRNCVYSHVAPQPIGLGSVVECENSSGSNVEQTDVCLDVVSGETSKSVSQAETSVSGSFKHELKPTTEKICKFFRAGYCRMGQRCHFKHSFSKRQHERRNVKVDGNLSGATFSGDRKSIQSEASSDSGLVEDIILKGKDEHTINEAKEGKVLETTKPADQKEVTVEETLRKLRKKEIEILKKRFSGAKENLSPDGETAFQFTFVPTDPDWPYDVKNMTFQVIFPEEYPSEMMNVVMVEDERVPETVRRLVTEAAQEFVCGRFEAVKRFGKHDLAFRPFLRWFDKNAEDILTDALKEFKRERMAEIAGIQFIPATQLRTKYRCSENEEQTQDDLDPNAKDKSECTVQPDDVEAMVVENKEDLLDNDNSDMVEQLSSQNTLNPVRRGTEVSLQNLQLTNYAATLSATHVSLMISCARCSNKTELQTKVGQPSKAECPYCHNQEVVMFRENIAHQFTSVIGYLDLEGCEAVDMMLSNCQFNLNCLECSKDNKLESLPPGQPNTTWCFHCHKKLTVAANNVRFVKLLTTTSLDIKKACTVEVKGKVKAVKDPAIVEGKPLPDNGTCKHFKKSYRWFRFPCCGKAYPCDFCHDEKENGHEMIRANRIICGFCAKEQSYSADHPCIGCHANTTNRSTSHWEGGTGCRDKIKMSRGDSKKYTDSLKTSSRSLQNKKDDGKKITKLRHI